MTSVITLFDGAGERVMLEAWEAGQEVRVANAAGLELLVVDGGFDDGTDVLRRWSWLRLPAGIPLMARVGGDGAHVWYKAGALLHAGVVPFDRPVAADGGR